VVAGGAELALQLLGVPRRRKTSMRTSVYPRAFSLYPNWLKPVLLSLGAMFAVTALFLMILIWKSAPSAAAVQASAVGALPSLSLASNSPLHGQPATAQAPAREVPVAAEPVPHKSAKRHKLAHHKKSRHAKAGHAKVAKRSKAHDPLLDLLR
jgi:hypothetical protein